MKRIRFHHEGKGRFDRKRSNLPFHLLASFLLIFGLISSSGAAEWEAPAWADTLSNPVSGDSALAAGAEALFMKNCAICHGAVGHGDGMMSEGMQPPPADFTDAEDMSSESDGELFWKISNGRKPMPTWKKELSEEQIWSLVKYVRHFSEPAAPPDSLKESSPEPQ